MPLSVRGDRRGTLPARAAALAVGLALLAGPAHATTTPSPAVGDPEVRVEVEELLPRAPSRADQPFQVAGRLVNATGTAVEELEVRVLVGGVLRSRSALAVADERPPGGRPRGPSVEPARTTLVEGSGTTFDLRFPVGALGMTRLGVYPVEVEVRGHAVGSRRTTTLGRATTYVPWFPDGTPAASRIAFVWPLVDVPARTPDGALLDTGLAESLGADDAGATGRLAALLAAARGGAGGGCEPRAAAAAEPAAPAEQPVPCRRDPVPLTVAVDPALLEAAATLAERHDVVTPGGGRRSEPPDPAAQQWLEDLTELVAGAPAEAGRAALPGADVLALPYADPDVVGLARSRTGLSQDVELLRTLGRRVAADALGTEPLDSVAWPPSGRLTAAALEAALGGEATAVVLDETALPPRRSDGGRTPSTRTDLTSASSGDVTGLVVDEGLSRLLTATPDDPGWQGARLAEQRWVAETAIVAAERPGESRTFLVAPPRRAAVHPEVGTAVLRDAGRLPWLCPVPLVDVVDGTETCPAGVNEPTTAPVSEDRGELVGTAVDGGGLSAELLRAVAQVKALGTQLTDEVLVPGSPAAAEVAARFLRARARAVSSAWWDRPEAARHLLQLYRDDVEHFRSAVQVRTSGRQLLTSTSGSIIVTISNSLDQPVTVGVALNDPAEARLTSTETGVRTIGPSTVETVRLQVQAQTSGQFVVRATLLDRSGEPFGEPAELVVRSTGYGRLALGITGVAAGILLVAAGGRILRRALRRPAALSDEDLA